MIFAIVCSLTLIPSSESSHSNYKYREGAVETSSASQQQQLASLLAAVLSQTQSDATLLTGRLCTTCATGCCCKDQCCDPSHCLNQLAANGQIPTVCDTCASRCCCGTSCCDSSLCFTTFKGSSSTIGPPLKQTEIQPSTINIPGLLAQFLQQQLANPTTNVQPLQPQSSINAYWCNSCSSRCCCDPLGCCTSSVCERLALTGQPQGDSSVRQPFVQPSNPTNPAINNLSPYLGTAATSQSLGTSTVFGSYVCLLCKSFCCCGTSCCAPSVCGLASAIDNNVVNPVMYPNQQVANYNNPNPTVTGVYCNVCASRCCCGPQCCPTYYCSNSANVRPTYPNVYPTSYNNLQSPNINGYPNQNYFNQGYSNNNNIPPYGSNTFPYGYPNSNPSAYSNLNNFNSYPYSGYSSNNNIAGYANSNNFNGYGYQNQNSPGYGYSNFNSNFNYGTPSLNANMPQYGYPNVNSQNNFGFPQANSQNFGPSLSPQNQPSSVNPYQLLDSLIPPKNHHRAKRSSKSTFLPASKQVRKRQIASTTCGVCITGCCCRSVCCDCTISSYYSTVGSLTTATLATSVPLQLATCACGQCGTQCCPCAPQPAPICTCGICGSQCCTCPTTAVVQPTTCTCGQCGTGCCSCPTPQFSYQNYNCGCGMCGGNCCSCTNPISNFCNVCNQQPSNNCSPCQSGCCCAGSAVCCSCTGFNGWGSLASLG